MMSEAERLVVSTPAWVLAPSEHYKIAIGESFMAEYVRDSLLHDIPGALNYCNQVLLWRDNFIPVIDINVILGDGALNDSHIAVVAYQEYAGQRPQYVAIKILGEVERVTVSDDMACDWPEAYPPELQPIVESLFMHQEKLVSIVSIADLCNEGYRDYIAQLEEIRAGL
jgi:chemotaxis signal transduction protein